MNPTRSDSDGGPAADAGARLDGGGRGEEELGHGPLTPWPRLGAHTRAHTHTHARARARARRLPDLGAAERGWGLGHHRAATQTSHDSDKA